MLAMVAILEHLRNTRRVPERIDGWLFREEKATRVCAFGRQQLQEMLCGSRKKLGMWADSFGVFEDWVVEGKWRGEGPNEGGSERAVSKNRVRIVNTEVRWTGGCKRR